MLKKTIFALTLGAAMAFGGAANAADKIKIGVSYPTPTHAWAAGMNWHAEQAESVLKLYIQISI